MRYKDLDGISKFQMDFFRSLMLNVTIHQEYAEKLAVPPNLSYEQY